MYSNTSKTCLSKIKTGAFSNENTSFLKQKARHLDAEERLNALVNCSLDTDISDVLTIEKEEFLKSKPGFLKNLENCYYKHYPDIPRDSIKRIIQIFDYNLPSTLACPGLVTVTLYKILNHKTLAETSLLDATILGWCADLHLVALTILDDIIDNSKIRNERSSWYLLPDVGLQAIVHANLILAAASHLIEEHFRNHPRYCDIVKCFQKCYAEVYMGQFLDLEAFRNDTIQPELFTIESYQVSSKYRVASFGIMQLHSVFYLSNYSDPELIKRAESIAKDVTQLYQIQNDFVEYHTRRHSGTDIEQGRPTWLAVTAWKKSSAEQRKILKSCYGSKNKNDIEAVHALFAELKLADLYFEVENEYLKMIEKKALELSDQLSPALFLHLVSKKSINVFNEKVQSEEKAQETGFD